VDSFHEDLHLFKVLSNLRICSGQRKFRNFCSSEPVVVAIDAFLLRLQVRSGLFTCLKAFKVSRHSYVKYPGPKSNQLQKPIYPTFHECQSILFYFHWKMNHLVFGFWTFLLFN
jgi:hypothetical protein